MVLFFKKLEFEVVILDYVVFLVIIDRKRLCFVECKVSIGFLRNVVNLILR